MARTTRSAFPFALSLALLAASAPVCYALAPQEIHGPLSPAGRLRIQVAPVFTSWDSRFGERNEDGSLVEEVEPLGFDLEGDIGRNLFPQVTDLEESLRIFLGDPSYQGELGGSSARVTASQVRVPLRMDLGVSSWLTVGVTVPLVRSWTDIALSLDTLGANLGLNPALTIQGSVDAFTGSLEASRAAALEAAGELCATDPASAECAQAGALADEGAALLAGFLSGYQASPFFPVGGSGAAESLLERVGSYNDGLTALGLTTLAGDPVFATGRLTQETFDQLFSSPGTGLSTLPLRNRVGIWELGDVEVHAAVRVLEGDRRALADSTAGAGFRYLLGAGFLVRLPTGVQDDPHLLLEVPAGDGQTDLEGRVFLNLQGERFGLWSDARYGIQRPVEVSRRIAPPEVALVPFANTAPVEWTPGSYLQLEVTPRLHFTEELAFTASYRYFGKGADEYARLTPAADGLESPPFYSDAALLARETEERVHEVGGGLVYSTVEAWRQGRTSFPFDVWFGVRSAVAGGGGRTPRAARATFGLRLYRGLWGGPAEGTSETPETSETR